MEIKRFIGGILEANGYVISDPQSGSCFIIDPGYRPKVFSQYIAKAGLDPAGILLTHHHSDHTGAAENLADRWDCPILMHEADAFVYRGRVDRMLHDQEVLLLEDEEIRVLSTPGHTKGSVCFYAGKSR